MKMQSMSSNNPRLAGGAFSYLSLFTSFGTLICCALPSMLVMLGLGATVATVLSEVPWLVALSHRKNLVFIFAGLLIASNFIYVYAIGPRLQAQRKCDPNDPTACEAASRLSCLVLWCSAVLYLAGCFSAYLLGPILIRLD